VNTRVWALLRRELVTVARTRAHAALGAGYAAVVVAVAWFSGGVTDGYLPAASSLMTPTELLVPVVSLVLGYRVVLNDRSTGELGVLKTYGLGRAEYVLGVYAGRLVALTTVVVTPLVIVGGTAWLYAGPHTDVISWYGGVDSPLLLVRFGILSVGLGGSVLALSLAVSAVSENARGALALAVTVWLALVLGADLGVVAGLTSGYLEGTVATLTALVPTSAFRGLVLETVVGAAAPGVGATSVPVAVVSTLVCTVGSLGVAARRLW